jgi:hypothetical protein
MLTFAWIRRGTCPCRPPRRSHEGVRHDNGFIQRHRIEVSGICCQQSRTNSPVAIVQYAHGRADQGYRLIVGTDGHSMSPRWRVVFEIRTNGGLGSGLIRHCGCGHGIAAFTLDACMRYSRPGVHDSEPAHTWYQRGCRCQYVPILCSTMEPSSMCASHLVNRTLRAASESCRSSARIRESVFEPSTVVDDRHDVCR